MTDKDRIRSVDIPSILKLRFPEYESSIRYYTEGERYPLNYPIIGEITGHIRAMLERDKTNPDALHQMKKLTDFAEEVLEMGDSSSKDLVVIEVIQLIDEPPFAGLRLEELLGSRSRAELEESRNS